VSDGRHGKDEPASMVAWLQAKIERLTADRDRIARDLAEREKLDQMTFAADLPAAAGGPPTGPLPAVPPQRTRSHRAARPTHLRRIKLLIPVAFTGGLGALRYAWHAHRLATVAAGVFTAAAVTAGTAAVAPHVPVLNAIASEPAATVPGWHTTATPILFPSAVARAASRAGLDAKSSRKSTPPLVDPPAPVPSASTRPSPVSSPAPYSPPAPSPPLLTLPAGPVDLGVYVSTVIEIGNPQDQAVSWSADCGQDVTASPAFGVLEPGQQGVQVRLSINPVDGASGALCRFSPGDEQLTVTWAGPGSPSAGI
jgi:hypothetical protein